MRCPYCSSLDTHKKGFAFNLNNKRQRYKCNNCKHKFMEAEEETPPAILFFDIETLPIVAYTWGTWGVDISNDKIIKDWCCLAFSAKWLDDNRIIADILTPKEVANRDDERLCKHVWKLLDDADIVVAQNGRRFDIPKMNGRFWKHGLGPPASYKIIDTMESAKKTFGLTYNSLDFLGEYLGAGRKLKIDFSLWEQCDQGHKDALKLMSEYNQQDVILLENVYNKMRPWIQNHPRLTLYDKVVGKCPVCLGGDYKKIGLYTAAQKQYAEYRCNSCGSVWHDTKAERNG